VDAIRGHLDEFVDAGLDAFVFTGPTGAAIWRGNFNKLIDWRATVAAMGTPCLHFHDLRHTGNVFAASTGASLRDLMARMGHDSSDAAMVYQHASSAADRAIADALEVVIRADKSRHDDPGDGVDGAESPTGSSHAGRRAGQVA
jgi:integrase